MHRGLAVTPRLGQTLAARRLATSLRSRQIAPVSVCKAPLLQRRWSSAPSEDPVPVSVVSGLDGVATVTLTRPKKLNSLSLSMMHELGRIYHGLEAAGTRCVLISGEGRAFCAGGDVAEVREGAIAGTRYPADFFYDEYSVDYHIATLHDRSKLLQVALWDGIVMGGGVGLSIHSPVRVATENTLFAMPETGIGLFPDVGATWALSRLSAGMPVGLFLGLTGQRLKAADCLKAGIATHFCPAERLGDLESSIRALGERANDVGAVAQAVLDVAGGTAPDSSKAVLEPNMETIERCFGGEISSAEEIVQRLESDGGEWAAKVAQTLRRVSPTSVKVSLEAILRHSQANVTLAEAFVAEYRMALRCMRPQPKGDFCEGIRAVLIDRDNKPVWDPPRLEDVTREDVNEFFAPLPEDHPRGDLKL